MSVPPPPPRMRPGAQYALRLVNLGAPVVRERFDRGVLVDPDGFPDWEFHARAMVSLPDPVPGLTVDEVRVVDVLAANALLRRAGTDPLWDGDDDDTAPAGTPQGWTWAHTGGPRRLALVPIELHASFRHAGGVSILPVDRAERGLRVDYRPTRVGVARSWPVPPDLLVGLESALRYALPPRYRDFLAHTNGAAPDAPGVLPGFGFVADQRFFGLARTDAAQDLIVANQYAADRFTPDHLGVGYVQGGTIAVKVRGADRDSIWYWDDDDDRADATDDAATVATRLLHRCAEDIGEFWDRLARPARALDDIATGWVDAGQVAQLHPAGLGESLPPGHRPPGWPPRRPDDEYFDDPAVRLALRREDPGAPAPAASHAYHRSDSRGEAQP